MRKRGNQIILLGLVLSWGLFSCGGSSNVDKVCGAAASELFDGCDQNDPEDQSIIWDALQGFGIAVSVDEIATISEGEVQGECVSAANEEEADISDEEADAFIATVEAASTCQSVVDTIIIGLNSL